MTIDAWIENPQRSAFPFDAVLREYWRVGKHFVERPMLEALARARRLVHGEAPIAGCRRTLAAFLDVVLDKHDGRYDYRSYLALALLPLPDGGNGRHRAAAAAAQRDHLLTLLVTDLLAFELRVLSGEQALLLPGMRPDGALIAKRCRLGLRALSPVLARSGYSVLPAPDGADDPLAQARVLVAEVNGQRSTEDAALLQRTMLPVYTLHDEYLFLRVLQSFETCFSFVCTALEATIRALHDGQAADACRRLLQCEAAFEEAAPLFSLMATMRPEAFRVFRQYTEGASAIQSRAYKRMEALCARPCAARLDSPGYRSVPELRAQIDDQWPTLQDACRAARMSRRIDASEHAAVQQRMADFEARVLGWRKMHHGLAVRMLGPASGTGYTEGTPYLRSVMAAPLFTASSAHATLPDEHSMEHV